MFFYVTSTANSNVDALDQEQLQDWLLTVNSEVEYLDHTVAEIKDDIDRYGYYTLEFDGIIYTVKC